MSTEEASGATSSPNPFRILFATLDSLHEELFYPKEEKHFFFNIEKPQRIGVSLECCSKSLRGAQA
jgi:hypothetical protein